MDPAVLIDPEFWADQTPMSPAPNAPELPDAPKLIGHVLFPTSGSTGYPKWIALSKRALLVSAEAVNRHLGVTADSCWGLALPVHHVGGFGVAARAYQAGCGFSMALRRWNPQHCVEWLSRSRVTHLSLVPTQVVDLVRAGLRAPEWLEAVVVGGGRLHQAQGRAARELGWPVLASFGMTEAASQIATQPVVALNEPYEPAPIPVLPIWETRCSDEGRLEITGPALFSGFLEGVEEGWQYRARTEKWYRTNDLVRIDDSGLTPLSRHDQVVKILGELVDLEAIERQLRSMAGDSIASLRFVVLAMPDERAGHRLVLVSDGSSSSTLERCFLNYNATAPGHARIAKLIQTDNIPVSELGKPLRRDLLDRLIRTDDL
jgi:O-succinylbenzoic acid--CoA ligase